MIYQSVFANWVDHIRETGGITDCPRDVSNAFKAAKSFCYSEVEKRGLDINPVINWAADLVAAYMVSCVKNDDSSIWDIMIYRDDFDDVFKAEAERNSGMIHDILFKAGQAQPRLLQTGLMTIISHLRIAPTGSGKGVGNIRRLF
jgi:hypothetical protein